MPTSWNATSRRFAALCFDCFFPQVHHCYSLALEEINLHTLHMRRPLRCTLFIQVLHAVLLFRKLLVFEFLLGISGGLLCSMSAPHVKIVPLLDVRQLLMLFAGAMTYLETRTFFLIIFYNTRML
jgi:hypothetical protein